MRSSIRSRLLSGLTALLLLTGPAYAVWPDEMLADSAMEARAREISQILRCVVCQNQSIDDSPALLARDLRVLVRERLQAGDSNEEALDFIVARYGNYVLLQPPFQWNTLILWLGPALFVLLATGSAALYFRRRLRQAQSAVEPLSADETAALAALMDEGLKR